MNDGPDREAAARILALLDRHYGTVIPCFLDHEHAWQLLAATILSARCTDDVVNTVTPALFRRYADPAAIARADVGELEAIIRPTGFFRQKAKHIIACFTAISDRHGGEVPRSAAELCALPGVGRKTANVVRATIFADPCIAVDTHVGRVSRRLGFTQEEDPVRVESDLELILPRENWIRFNPQLINNGRAVCRGQNPQCTSCFLQDDCRLAKSRASISR